MNLRKVTGILIASVAVIAIGYDVYAYFYGDSATISEWFQRNAPQYLIIPFAMGYLVCHLLSPYRGT